MNFFFLVSVQICGYIYDELWTCVLHRLLHLFMLDILYDVYIVFFQTVYIPGDNDIGGEAGDLLEAWKMNRFNEYFEDDADSLSYKSLQIQKVCVCFFL